MTVLITGHRGVLGSELMKRYPMATGGDRNCEVWHSMSLAYLCGGTKGWAENEGRRDIFRYDVDGNIRLARNLLKQGAFVVFISTDGVEWGANLAYGRNRLLVEMALIMQPNTAIVRPSKFDASSVASLADLCVDVGKNKREGLHYWEKKK